MNLNRADASWSRAEADIYSASYEHDSLEPMATAESRSSELMSSDEVDMEDVGADAHVPLPCPICRAYASYSPLSIPPLFECLRNVLNYLKYDIVL